MAEQDSRFNLRITPPFNQSISGAFITKLISIRDISLSLDLTFSLMSNIEK
jgi:hypothetical protein